MKLINFYYLVHPSIKEIDNTCKRKKTIRIKLTFFSTTMTMDTTTATEDNRHNSQKRYHNIDEHKCNSHS